MITDDRVAPRPVAHAAAAAAPVATPKPRRFRADIQGLRAVAVGLVLLDHAGLSLFGGGFVGVDVFFVISGFLISSHLLGSLFSRGRIDLLGFYAARARRILPAALVTIAATAAAAFVLVSPLRVTQILHDGIASALYVPNILFAVRQTDYLAGTEPSPFQHFWSLGVEEQFYLFWPLLLVAAYVLARRSLRGVMLVIALVAALSFVASVVTTTDAPSLAFFSPHTRAWEFAVGALVAGAMPALSRVPALVAHALSWVGLALILVAAVRFSAETSYPGSAAMLPVVGAALVIGFGARGAGGAVAVLGLRPMQFIGTISYSLYLVHWPILVLVHEHLGLDEPLRARWGLVLVVASIPLAWLLYRFVETPFRAARADAGAVASGGGSDAGAAAAGGSPRRERAASARAASRRIIVIAGAATVALVASLVAAGAAAAQIPLASTHVVAAEAPTPLPTGTPFVPANLSPTLADATTDTGAIYTDGCQQGLGSAKVLSCTFGDKASTKTIALFGDSHAGRWFPALEVVAANLGYRLDTYTKSGCRSEETIEAWDNAANTTCSAWRDDVVARLNAAPPAFVVLANHLGPRPDKDQIKEQADWTAGLEGVYARLPGASHIITMADTPEFASSPVVCLSAHLDDTRSCAVDRGAAFNPGIRAAQAAATEAQGSTLIDLDDYFCNTKECPPIIGPTLAYSDEHHVTATFSRELAPVLQKALEPVLDASG